MATIAALVPDLFFASKVDATLTAAGHQVIPVADVAAAQAAGAAVIVADLGAIGPEDLAEAGAPVLGFYPHTDTDLRARADAARLARVVPRSRAARELPELVAGLLSG